MDKKLIEFAAWILRYVLQQAIENPEKRREIVKIAREKLRQVDDLLSALETDTL
jgi:hypothetical protein